jgi:cytochrome c peroxidase
VRDDIKLILKNEKWDDGSIGPLLIRLAWHASGTYCKATGTGGTQIHIVV